MRWRAAASPGGLIGILLAILSALVAGGALLVLLGQASLPLPGVVVWLGLLLAVALAIAFIYLVYAYLTIGYELGETTLVIRWANQRDIISLADVEQIGPAIQRIEERPGRWQRFWPGYYVGTQRTKVGPTQVVATLPLRRQLLITTEKGAYLISPERPVLFVEEYGRLRRSLDLQRSGAFPTIEPGQGAQRLADAGWTMQFPIEVPDLLGAARSAQRASSPELPAAESQASSRGAEGEASIGPAVRPTLLGDSTALTLLAVSVLLNVVMVIYILLQRDSIPPAITLHWNANGFPDRIGSPREIWVLPLITGLVTMANFGLAWSIVSFDRFAARFLLGSTILVQIVAWVAVITLIS